MSLRSPLTQHRTTCFRPAAPGKRSPCKQPVNAFCGPYADLQGCQIGLKSSIGLFERLGRHKFGYFLHVVGSFSSKKIPLSTAQTDKATVRHFVRFYMPTRDRIRTVIYGIDRKLNHVYDNMVYRCAALYMPIQMASVSILPVRRFINTLIPCSNRAK